MAENYKVVLEIAVDDNLIESNTFIPMTKSHRNALMREAVWKQVSEALHFHGLDLHAITSVVKVQKKEGKK